MLFGSRARRALAIFTGLMFVVGLAACDDPFKKGPPLKDVPPELIDLAITIFLLDPEFGQLGGGNQVIIDGKGFTGVNAVLFGSQPSPSFTVSDDNTIIAVAPPGSGLVDVRLKTSKGMSANTPADNYNYVPVGIYSVSPDNGTMGQTVSISGFGFTGTTGVEFNGSTVPPGFPGGFVVVDDTLITATAPAHAPGTVDVVVTSPAGTSFDSPLDDFTYN